jgi:hypothetical protein
MAEPTRESAPTFECEALDADLPLIAVNRFYGRFLEAHGVPYIDPE